MTFRHAALALALSTSAFSRFSYGFDIIAHRGASGYLPEHTLEAAALAYAQHPSYIEQDVVITKDGVPVVLHDIHLETVTDVEAVYPQRARSDGRYYALDFTLEELRQLRVHERQNEKGEAVFPHRYQGDKATFRVATLDAHIELIQQLNRISDQDIGFYVEIKSPQWHRQQGVDISAILLDTLKATNLAGKDANLYLQCFDFAEVKRLRNELGFKGKLIQLLGENSWGESVTDNDWLMSDDGLSELATVADGVGPWLGQLLDAQALKKAKIVVQPWLATAQKQGLLIHPYTFRVDALPAGLSEEQVLSLLIEQLKVDGVFTDQVPPIKQFLMQNK
ncbi:glycerophosphodiester phosphodiesterase [Alteromonas pelagimontana]|uniref:glycerophosphodiester phosphodiesterase n=1 Tax=Alteromonas pelagimontana TaxID=1858656 RepID=A0A6M4M9Q8_9ALTE|nr:glycerophosphodiester phosphodiesterase [Alteromonas pelagimontana]QJR79901.1 glycerophosphodiester phosphodiesterase [Alteromonas pelagimontana]